MIVPFHRHPASVWPTCGPLIELLSAEDQPTQLAETLLGTMKDTLRLFEEHRQSMPLYRSFYRLLGRRGTG